MICASVRFEVASDLEADGRRVEARAITVFIRS